MPERYQQEIEEILRQSGDLTQKSGKNRQGLLFLTWSYVLQSFRGKLWSISPGQVMLAALCFLLASLLLGSVIPGFVSLMAWGGLLLFIVGYAMFFVTPPKIEKRWRGRRIDLEGGSWFDRIKRRSR
jgi:hypothetical protein